MKKLTFFIAILIAFSLTSVISFGQTRPKKRTAAPVSKTKAETPTEVEIAPGKKTVIEVSSAKGFFNQGLKCEAKDYDCQISNYTKAINLDLNTKEVFKNRGNAYLQRKDFEKAIADFTKLIELDLNDASGYKNRGRIYLENSNSPQAVNAAVRDFTSAIDLEPKDVEAYKLRSSAYMKLRDYDKAKADMDKIAAIEPNNVDVIIIQGEMFLADKQYEKATESLTKAIAVKPTSKLYLDRANAYAAQKKYDVAVSDFSKVIELDPKNADAYNARGNAYLQLDKTDLAIRDINKAIELDPTRLGSLLELAKSLEKQMKYDDAIKIYDAVLASAPKDNASEYFYNRGSLNLLKQDANLAIADATKSLEINPKNAKAFELRCGAFFSLKDYQSATDDCSDAIDLDSNLDNAYIYRATVAITLTGKLEGQAQDDFNRGYSNMVANANKILVQKPDDFDALVKRAGGNMGLKSYAAAIQDYKSLIDLNPKYEQAYNLLASCNSLMNGFTESTLATNVNFQIQTLTRGISANPESVTLYYERGIVYLIKDDRSAVNDFNKAIQNYTKKTKPTESEKISVQLAIAYGASAYYGLKDNTNALATINKCDELFPENVSCLTYKGKFYLGSLKDFQKAVDAYNKAIDLFLLKKSSAIMSNPPDTFYQLAVAYFGLNDKGNAIAAINKGLSLYPNNGYMWTYAGTFYQYEIKDTGKATEHYNKAAQLGSEVAKIVLNSIAQDKQRTADSIAEDKQRKKARRNAAILAVMGAVNQSLETYNSSRQNSSTSQTPQPNIPTSPQNTSGRQTSSTNASSTISSTNTNNSSQNTSTTGGNTAPKRSWASIAQVPPPSESCSKSSYLPAGQRERCWGSWQATVFPQIQIRVKGPLATAGNLVNDDARYKATYYWYIQVKNTSNEIISVEDEIIFGDGKVTRQGFHVTPGGTAYHDTMTLSATETINIKLSNLESCKHWTKEGNMYRCSE